MNDRPAIAARAAETRGASLDYAGVGKRYGSIRGGLDSRNLFVIDSSGRIAHRMIPFNELAQTSYEELEQAVRKTLPAR